MKTINTVVIATGKLMAPMSSACPENINGGAKTGSLGVAGRRTRRVVFLMLAMTVTSYIVPSNALASVYQVEIPDCYGTVNQHDMSVLPEMSCGPASAANGIQFLQRVSDMVGDNSLVPWPGYYGQVSLAETLAISYMHTDAVNGTFHDNYIAGTTRYIEEKAPGIFTYRAQDQWGWSHATKPAWVQGGTIPTWSFLYDSLDQPLG